MYFYSMHICNFRTQYGMGLVQADVADIFGFMLKLKRSFLDRIVFQRLGPFYSHIPDSCHKSHDLL